MASFHVQHQHLYSHGQDHTLFSEDKYPGSVLIGIHHYVIPRLCWSYYCLVVSIASQIYIVLVSGCGPLCHVDPECTPWWSCPLSPKEHGSTMYFWWLCQYHLNESAMYQSAAIFIYRLYVIAYSPSSSPLYLTPYFKVSQISHIFQTSHFGGKLLYKEITHLEEGEVSHFVMIKCPNKVPY